MLSSDSCKLPGMKPFVLFCTFLLTGVAIRAQSDTLLPYQQVPIIPAFNLQITDSTTFAKKDLPRKTPVVIIYFNPECGHCQAEAKELSANMDKFKKVFFVFAASQPLDLITEFAEMYGLNTYRNIRMGQDQKYFLSIFYKIRTTPFSALYDKKGKLVTVFREGMSVEALQKALQ